MPSDSPYYQELQLILRDKYAGDATPEQLAADEARLVAGEPLAYIIGWVPFINLKIYLDSHPLIPRPETEWWTEKLIDHLQYRFGDKPFKLIDLCAGSGAIGLSVLNAFPNCQVYFGELVPKHVELIKKNSIENNLDTSRAGVYESNLFDAFSLQEPLADYNLIVTNPPYIPESRELEASVTGYEPAEALFAGPDGMRIINKILTQAAQYLLPDGELWIECDIANATATHDLAISVGASEATIHMDQYGRPRLLTARFE